MHEYSIVQALLDRIDEEARKHHASRVHRVRISIGELAGVEVDLLKTAFETIQHRTICDGSELHVTRIAARWECRHCQTPIARGARLTCAACGSPARLAAGDEITLDQVELETSHV